jgi:creatinine amidohydrolase
MKPIAYEQISGPEFARLIGPDDLILIPISAPENHGEHLPLGTDLYISEAIAKQTAEVYLRLAPGAKVFLYPGVSIGGATIRGRGSVKIRSKELRKDLTFLGGGLFCRAFGRLRFCQATGACPMSRRWTWRLRR